HVTLEPANVAPVVQDLHFEGRAHATIGQPVVIGRLLDAASDADGDHPQIISIDPPTNGRLQDDGTGVYTYYPSANTLGDVFRFGVSDGYGISWGTVHLSWRNNRPIASPDSFDVNLVDSLSDPIITEHNQFTPDPNYHGPGVRGNLEDPHLNL